MPQVCHIFLVSWFYVWTVLQVSEQATKLFCLNKFVCHVSSVCQACLCIFCKQALFPLFLLPKFQQSHITNSEFFHSIRCVAKQSDQEAQAKDPPPLGYYQFAHVSVREHVSWTSKWNKVEFVNQLAMVGCLTECVQYTVRSLCKNRLWRRSSHSRSKIVISPTPLSLTQNLLRLLPEL